MLTLKEVIQVKLAAQFMNDLDTRQIIMCSKNEIWSEVIRKETSALCIPFTLQEDIIASIEPMTLQISDWLDDHNGIFTKKQEDSLKFCFYADGDVDRVKTADLLIHSEVLDVQTRFLLACQYWSMWDVLAFFKNLQDFEREQILHKYSTANEDLNLYEKNAVQWVKDYKEGSINESRSWCYQYYNWNYVSLQSHLLDDLTEEERYIVLDRVFETTSCLRINYFCLSKMSANHRDDVLKRYPVKVVHYYLLLRDERLFIDAVNKVWDRLPQKHFLCLLHIIICHKILLLHEDLDYVNLLREFWYSSPENFKQYVEKTDIFEILMEILKNGFFPNRATRNFFLHDSSSSINNLKSCCHKITEMYEYQ